MFTGLKKCERVDRAKRLVRRAGRAGSPAGGDARRYEAHGRFRQKAPALRFLCSLLCPAFWISG